MTTLYKNTSRIAAAIVASVVFSSGAAIALTHDRFEPVKSVAAPTTHDDNLGRFVVTPKSMSYVPAANTTASVGRFVVSQHRAVFVPAVSSTLG
jgi:hypothetical protein